MLGEVTELIEGLGSTVLKRLVLKHIDLLIVIAEVGIDELVVAWLAHVDHTTELAVDVFHHLNGTLQVEVDAGALDDGGEGWIHETGVVAPDVIAAVAQDDCFATDIGFLWKEGKVKTVLTVEDLVRLQFHRTRVDHSRPAARHADVYILVEEHAFSGTDIAEVHRTVPIHIPVDSIITSIAAFPVLTHNVDAPHRVGEVFLVADDGDNGYRVGSVVMDITTGDGYTRQITILEETEHVVGSLADGELSVRTLATGGVACFGHATVGGVHQCRTFRYGNLDLQ